MNAPFFPLFVALVLTAPTQMRRVDAARYVPIDQPNAPKTEVAAFEIDARPVSNAEFLRFVTAHPQWRRGTVKRAFAEPSYLSLWEGPLTLGARVLADAPVMEVSWFSADAYCGAQQKRLPSEAEWEVAGIQTPHWEWVFDFTASLAPSDRRGGSDPGFCGTAPGVSAEPAAYAAFMRRALRSSLEGAFALSSLGFRCARALALQEKP